MPVIEAASPLRIGQEDLTVLCGDGHRDRQCIDQAFELLLCQLAFRDVRDHAADELRPPAIVVHDEEALVAREHAAVAAAHRHLSRPGTVQPHRRQDHLVEAHALLFGIVVGTTRPIAVVVHTLPEHVVQCPIHVDDLGVHAGDDEAETRRLREGPEQLEILLRRLAFGDVPVHADQLRWLAFPGRDRGDRAIQVVQRTVGTDRAEIHVRIAATAHDLAQIVDQKLAILRVYAAQPLIYRDAGPGRKSVDLEQVLVEDQTAAPVRQTLPDAERDGLGRHRKALVGRGETAIEVHHAQFSLFARRDVGMDTERTHRLAFVVTFEHMAARQDPAITAVFGP